MLTGFGTVFIFFVAAVVFVAVSLLVQRLLSTRRPSEVKQSTYECGEEAVGTPWVQFNIRFYVFAIAFLIFDVEVVFLLPWAVAYHDLGTKGARWVGFADGMLFVLILFVGLVWAWAKGHLEWVKPRLPFAGERPAGEAPGEAPAGGAGGGGPRVP